MSALKNILVAGGSGTLGKDVVRGLVAAGFRVFVLSRKETIASGKTADLEKLGAEIREGDSLDKSSLASALKGIDAIVSTLSGAAVKDGQINLIEAAAAAKTIRFFVPSDFGVDLYRTGPQEVPFFTAKKAVNEALYKSGLAYAHICNGFFINTTFNGWFGLDLDSGKVTIPGDGKSVISWTTTKDVGRFVAGVLRRYEDYKNRAVFVSGDEASLLDIVHLYEVVNKKKVQVSFRSLDELRAVVKSAAHPFDKAVEQLLVILANGSAEIKTPRHTYEFAEDVDATTLRQ